MRGGVSRTRWLRTQLVSSSPHAWGCFLRRRARPFYTSSLPHMRGGVSNNLYPFDSLSSSSPHAWGCFSHRRKSTGLKKVFPTCVGVFLSLITRRKRMHCLPHMRGGVSELIQSLESAGESSPHAWGCFRVERFMSNSITVFPTCVGVFPAFQSRSDLMVCLPHMRGGVSSIICGGIALRVSSPHAWGCFPAAGRRADGCRVFPTCVGVFLHHV